MFAITNMFDLGSNFCLSQKSGKRKASFRRDNNACCAYLHSSYLTLLSLTIFISICLSLHYTMNNGIERLVLMTFLLTPWLLFLLWIFSVWRENKKDIYTFGILFLGSIIAIIFMILHTRWDSI